MTTILPTHRCFDDMLDYLALRLRNDKRLVPQLFLVHGILLNPDNGEPFAHAWVEERQVVWNSGILDGVDQTVDGSKIYFSCSRVEWYVEMKPQHFTRYTAAQASSENVRSGHYGPWVEAYRALCKRVESETEQVALEAKCSSD